MASAVSCFLFLQLLGLPFVTIAQTGGNIGLGSYLTANNDYTSWKSPYGDFAFGFRQQTGRGGFLLAIWFDKIPEKTIVWSANANNLVQRGSKIQLTKDGMFVLTDPKGQQVWTAIPTGTAGAAYAAMLDDTGNFVLTSRDSVSLWQSFEQPTDTILPTQTLNPGSRLFARFSQTNYSNGRFQLLLQTDGTLSLYTTTGFTLDSVNSAYWSARQAGSGGARLIFKSFGNVDLITAANGDVVDSVLSNAASTEDYYQRAVLDYDGVFRLYIYPKNRERSNVAAATGNNQWSPLSFVPWDICLSITQSTGGGACGFNSYCSQNQGRPICKCPYGYTFIDPSDELGGCKQAFVPQSCDGDGLNEIRGGYEIIEMVNTDWPLSDYEYYRAVSEEWCRGACLDDCFCGVAIFRDGKCWKKRIPLSNGRFNPSVGGKALIKVRK